ncbi:MAG TPA: hypothetical protein VK081_05320 [Planctomycetota bacterium]|nr:hypothetical protein [Planctomycetota bacterium]
MNTFPHPEDPEAVALARVVAREDDASDWDLLHAIAARDDGVWRRLALALHDDARLRAALRPVLAAADEVALPAAPARLPSRKARLAAAGAVAAAALACAALCLLPERRAANPTDPAEHHELPRIVLQARPAPGGRGTEVVWLRRTLERAVVDRVFELGTDEYGEPRPRPVDAARFAGPVRF